MTQQKIYGMFDITFHQPVGVFVVVGSSDKEHQRGHAIFCLYI
eukprot:CAMPEP_0194363504 /NCGR_PEP_ID=MMETSP0174-20130528/11320_1 /TAXON_ID=216777 /ORGANISM="Proboscia alata, Strain PI-D3" /LENGTH=42 /DNA_ID= /DNA_START= /DNA_END= /DNA_ORIENTATION=